MSSNASLKPIVLYGDAGPNPPKVAMLLAELNLPYTITPVAWSDVKGPSYTAININGRLPAIQDPNTNLTLWESGAILEYLIEKYDTNHTLSFPAGSNEAYLAKQWLYFQVSGQGPYFGQAVWFKKFHHEQLPSAQERYLKEVDRVSSVLEAWLEKQKAEYNGQGGDGPWLVGGRISYADISFLQWYRVGGMALSKEEFDVQKYPLLDEWLNKISGREKIKEVIEAGVQH